MAPERRRRLSASDRLTQAAALDQVRREGKRLRTERLELRFLASPLLRPRIGIIVPRHHRSAVDRNRVKRRLRELLRAELLPLLRSRAPLDVVVRAAPEAYRAGFPELAADVQRLTKRLVEAK